MCSLCVLKLVHQALKTIAKSVVKMKVSDSLYFPRIFDQKCRSGGGGATIYIYIYIYIYIEREREREREVRTWRGEERRCPSAGGERSRTAFRRGDRLTRSALMVKHVLYIHLYTCIYIYIYILLWTRLRQYIQLFTNLLKGWCIANLP